MREQPTVSLVFRNDGAFMEAFTTAAEATRWVDKQYDNNRVPANSNEAVLHVRTVPLRGDVF